MLMLIGTAGIYYLTRNVLLFNRIGALFSSIVFSLCSWWPAEVRSGSYAKFYFYLLPLALALFIKAKENKMFIVLSSLLLGVVILQSGLTSAIFFLFLLLYVLVHSPKHIKEFFIIACFSLLLGIVRIVPVVELLMSGGLHTVSDVPKTYLEFCNNVETVQLVGLMKNMLFAPKKAGSLYYDYSHSLMYIGIIPSLLFLGSCIFCIRNLFKKIILLTILTLISLGNTAFFNMHRLIWFILWPFRHIYKLDKYFIVPILLLVAIIIGQFITHYSKLKKFKITSFALVSALLLISVFQLFSARWLCSNIFKEPVPIVSKGEGFFQVTLEGAIAGPSLKERSNFYSLQQYLNVCQGIGTITAVIPFVYGEKAIPKFIYKISEEYWARRRIGAVPIYLKKIPVAEYKGEVFFIDKKNKLKIQLFSPRRIKIKVDVSQPGKLVVNQNYYRGWRCDTGQTASYNGLLCVDLIKQGSYNVNLYYNPFTFYIAAIISFISLCFIIYRGRHENNT